MSLSNLPAVPGIVGPRAWPPPPQPTEPRPQPTGPPAPYGSGAARGRTVSRPMGDEPPRTPGSSHPRTPLLSARATSPFGGGTTRRDREERREARERDRDEHNYENQRGTPLDERMLDWTQRLVRMENVVRTSSAELVAGLRRINEAEANMEDRYDKD